MSRHYEETLDALSEADLKLFSALDWSKVSIQSTQRTKKNG
jgi:hypothetical protein